MAKVELEQVNVAHMWIFGERGGSRVHSTYESIGKTELFEVDDELVAIYPESVADNPNPDSWRTRFYLSARTELIEDYKLQAPRLSAELRELRERRIDAEIS